MTRILGNIVLKCERLLLKSTQGISKGLLFHTNDTEDNAYAKYLLRYMLYMAIEWNCGQGFGE